MSKATKFFVVSYLAFFVIGTVIYTQGDHGDFVLWLNGLNTPFLDIFFKFATYLGDGVTLIALAILLIIISRRYGLILGLIGVVQAIVSYVSKRIVFGRTPRPKKFFDDISQLHFVDGVEVNGFYSMPSGHTMTAFSIAMFLAIYFKRPIISVVLLFGAVLVGLSRVYLLQHFLIDILVGSFIGMLLSLAAARIFQRYLEPVN
jgi:membrane-associated phospholipid phosphatase